MRPLRALAFAGAFAAVIAACGDSGGAEIKALSIVGTGDSYTGLPAELDAGIYEVTFRNDAESADGPLLISNGGNTPDKFLADLAPVLEGGGALADYVTRVVGLPTVRAGGTVTSTFTIPPGEYFLMSFFDGESEPVLTAVTVSGDSPDVADLPDGRTVIAARDYQFDISNLRPGAQTLTFRNDGPNELHHGVFVKFADGTSVEKAKADLATFFELEEGAEPPAGLAEPEEMGDTGLFSAGTGGTIDITLEDGGTYGVMCFINDRKGGPPHAFAYNMVEVFQVGT